jgi:hypothetical protein
MFMIEPLKSNAILRIWDREKEARKDWIDDVASLYAWEERAVHL